ncbi:tetraprenyl-beta-curcumene synthase family protein [Bacillus sp. CGMCC 1.16607]|uniref:tetraprenyl-beta-curcumene synthase family protein n=1 Tax=Bacillus sp. CGMCC 1.16607 TaxID=3351842 RepID=UPI003627E10D
MKVPTSSIGLMSQVYMNILPTVHNELNYWKKRASEIPNDELRKQALASIEHKAFHCEGGGILAILSQQEYKKAIRFIVAYQTISDYLDNLCDRSTSLDPDDFAALHESMSDALTPNRKGDNYYRNRLEQNDGGYLEELVQTCQSVLANIPEYQAIQMNLLTLCHYYCDLQIHKHVVVSERVPRLENWFGKYEASLPPMKWYEFSACSGSTLGIFCLISYAMRKDFRKVDALKLYNGYFPYIQGLHILLDYFIDQEEDLAGGDLNFCFYYKNHEELFTRLTHFLKEADRHTKDIPHRKFHQLINRGLIGIYLSDEKVKQQPKVDKLAKELIKQGGLISSFFYWNGRAYRRFQKGIMKSNATYAQNKEA